SRLRSEPAPPAPTPRAQWASVVRVVLGRIRSERRQIADSVVELAVEGDLLVDRSSTLQAAGDALEPATGGVLDPADQFCELLIGRRVSNHGKRMVRPDARAGDEAV